ncbi:AAA family ATPase [Knoellia sp. S7-12]|uniref:AAA family ATPase n=1 Tax=Knoellia sp. S7-12 TaxID=3126698 RepID=UPI00336842D5
MTEPESMPVLVARDTELTTLRRYLLQGGRPGPGVVLVTGASGTGTSALVRQLAREHREAGGRVLSALAVPWETDVHHGVLAQLLGMPLPQMEVLATADRVVGALGEPSGAGPTLLVVDDAHWSDPASLQALSTAVRHHHQAPMLVLCAASVGAPAAPTGSAAVLDRADQTIVVPPLSATSVQLLAAGVGIALHPSLADRLCRFTGGRPGPVIALLRELPAEFWSDFEPDFPAPCAVAADVAQRLRALTPDARQLAEVVAVLRRGPVPLAASVSGLDQPLPAIDELVDAGIITVVAGSGVTVVRPSDPMLAAAVLGSLGRVRKAELHRTVADLIEDPVARLTHMVAAAPLPDAALADELDALAEERAQTGQWATVADLLSRSARVTSDAIVREDRLSRAFDARVGSGDTLGAASAVAEVESLRETPLRNAALGYLAIVRGRSTEAESRLVRAWDLVNIERNPDTAALICQRRVLHSLARCRGDELVHWADRALELAPTGSPVAVEALAIRGLGLAGTGHGRAALDGYERLANEVGHGAQGQRVAMGRGWLALALDEIDEARASLASATSTDFLGGSTRISLWAHAWLARAQFVSGEWDDALRTGEQGMVLAEQTGMRLIQPLLAWTQAQVHSLRGDWSGADLAVRDAVAGPRDYEIMRVASSLARASVAEARADYAGVLRAVEPLRQPWARGSIDEPGAWPWPDVCANALAIEGRYDEAETFLEPHEQLAAERGHRSAQARLGYARGRLLGATGNLPAAREAFEGSASLLADLPLPYDRARTHFAWGQTLRRAGKRREADAVLQTARDLYDNLGATTYVERCDRELRAGGVHASRPPLADRSAETLTPQEELVADLVASGMTNREVGTELYVSTKTVQYHLTRIYGKLGIRSRGELAALRGSPREEPAQP